MGKGKVVEVHHGHAIDLIYLEAISISDHPLPSQIVKSGQRILTSVPDFSHRTP